MELIIFLNTEMINNILEIVCNWLIQGVLVQLKGHFIIPHLEETRLLCLILKKYTLSFPVWYCFLCEH